MTLKAICECWTCGECGNAPGRSGYCLNCEVTDSGAPGTHAQPETPEPIDWSGVEAPNVIAAYPAAHAEIVRRWNTHEAMLEALRDCRESLEAALEHITKDGMTDEHEELYYLGIAASDNAKAALVAAEGPGDTQRLTSGA